MIAFIEGVLVDKQMTHVVINVGGIGLEAAIPLSSYHALGERDQIVRIETYLYVREDVLQLYGFATPNEKRLFQLLISVTGIGPKVALSVLSGASVSDFANAVLAEDVKTLSSVPGIGKKTAQRLVMELKDSVSKAGFETKITLPMSGTPVEQDMVEDAILGLVSLGYERAEARQLVVRATAGLDGTPTTDRLIRRALQEGGRGR